MNPSVNLRASRVFAVLLAFTMLTPLVAAVRPANAQLFKRQQSGMPQQGMSTRKKVVLLGGAALLYYLFRKHQAKKEEEARMNPNMGNMRNGNQVANTRPQLYRSKNGGIYYRDQNKRPVWLTVPNQSLQVPAAEVTRYAPDYNRYRGPAPSAPSGYRTEQFSDFDGGLLSSSNGTAYPSGPRRN
jgi:hypothetical protein